VVLLVVLVVLVVLLVLVVVVTKFLAKGNFHKQERRDK
jgi:NADH:ubiquinone oxidoreductase subunit 3 (subunit A)